MEGKPEEEETKGPYTHKNNNKKPKNPKPQSKHPQNSTKTPNTNTSKPRKRSRNKTWIAKWLRFTNHKSLLTHTNLLPCKCPHSSKWSTAIDQTRQWTIEQLQDTCYNQFRPLKYIIDLTNTDAYYGDQDVKSDEVEHLKVRIVGQMVPDVGVVRRVVELMERFVVVDGEVGYTVALHCTHGVSRTGFFVVLFLKKAMELTIREAREEFEKARGYGVENEILVPVLDYLEDIEAVETLLSFEDTCHHLEEYIRSNGQKRKIGKGATTTTSQLLEHIINI